MRRGKAAKKEETSCVRNLGITSGSDFWERRWTEKQGGGGKEKFTMLLEGRERSFCPRTKLGLQKTGTGRGGELKNESERKSINLKGWHERTKKN